MPKDNPTSPAPATSPEPREPKERLRLTKTGKPRAWVGEDGLPIVRKPGFPWDRRRDEGIKAYRAFKTYLTMGDSRSTHKAALKDSRPERAYEEWSVRHDWVARVEAWDDYHNREVLRRLARSHGPTREKQRLLAAALLAKVAQRLQTLSPETLSPRDVSAIFAVASKAELLAVGAPTDITAEGSPEDRARAQAEARRELRERLEALLDEHSGGKPGA